MPYDIIKRQVRRSTPGHAEGDGRQHGLGAVAYLQMLVDVANVVADRPFAQVEHGADLTVRLAVHHQLQDLRLPLRQDWGVFAAQAGAV